MGIRSTLELLRLSAPTPAASSGSTGTTAMISPWQEGALSPIVWSDIFGLANVPMTRLEAMRVPAIFKARAVLHAVIGSRPLRVMRGEEFLPDADQPTWLYRSNSGVAPQQRVKDILDDLIFNEASLLLVERGAPSPGAAHAPIQDAVHVPYDRWYVDEVGRVIVDDEVAPTDSAVVIYGPGPGLLITAAEVIRSSRDMSAAITSRLKTPMPSLMLKELEEGRIGDEKKAEYARAIAKARRSPEGAVMIIPFGLDAELANPNDDAGLFIEGRNAARLDVANFMNMPAALLDGSTASASLTYSTEQGHRNELFDYTVPFWSDPITDVLSLDNVCPRGQRIRFDFTDFIAPAASPTGPVTED